MNTIKKEKHSETFNEVLLSYVEMCYTVALALTHDRDSARDLAWEVLSEAWHLRDGKEVEADLKSNLLFALRRRFINKYTQNSIRLGNAPALMERN